MAFAGFSQQELSVQLLQRSIERGRLAHAYLLTGDDLDHLRAVAVTLAKTLNCARPVRRGKDAAAVDCCDRCASCGRIDAENHSDVVWVRPESKLRIISIEQIRELIHAVSLKPGEGGYKISVIVGADRLNVAAANAFLKTLEEPPPRSVLILLSTEPQRMLETILSRCLRLSFAGEGALAVAPEDLEWLTAFANLCVQGKAGLLSRYRLLAHVMARLAGLKETIDKALTARSPLEKYDDIEPKLREKWEDELSAAIESEYRGRRAGLVLTLQNWFRDVWCQKIVGAADLLLIPELAAAGGTVAKRISADDAQENLRNLDQLQRLLATNVQEALALEVALLKLRI